MFRGFFQNTTKYATSKVTIENMVSRLEEARLRIQPNKPSLNSQSSSDKKSYLESILHCNDRSEGLVPTQLLTPHHLFWVIFNYSPKYGYPN